ncbi:hypothetical protein AGDE_16153 [Angomonas deanei]|uniref:Uncharacterized protein n=1 Tax=Angomonas deanei TaxID=59799 RepID=A0A7G2CQC5_9TRYP|nr:hypothetical protein AGDE_16153 [Angomonas deanei]CAD2221327.1 hypothetical protein, conserved [Angomonas deanei]|eukprot:EPY17624.1 hypothetical protein AGDE_16153 [Angomonas deanei]
MNIEVRSISDLPELALVDVFQWPTLSLLQHHVGDSLSTPADPDRPRPVGQFSFTTPVASMEYTPPLRTTSSKTGPTEKEMRESMEQTVTQLCSQLEALDEEEQRPQRSLYSLRSALLRSLVTTLKEKGETEMESSFQMGRETFNNTIAIHPSNETRYDGRPDDGKPNKIILYVYNNSLSKGWLRETILEQLNEVGARDMVTRTAVSLTLLSCTETRASEAFFELFTIIVQRSTFDFDDKKCVKEMRECLFPLLYLVQHGSWTTETLCGLSTLIAWLPTPPASEETETFQVVNQLRVSLNPKREPHDTGDDEPHHPHHADRVGMPLDSSLSDLSNISLQSSSAVRSSALQEPISEQRAEETEDAASSVGGSDGGPTIHRTVALSNDFFRHRLREFHESFRSWFSPVFSVDPTTQVKMHFLSSTDCDHIYLVLLPPTVTPDDLATKREPIASRLASPDRDSVVEMTGGTVAVLLSDRKRGDLTRQPYPRFEAQVTLTNTKTLDTSVTGEWHELVQNLRVILARQLLHTIRTSDTGCAPFKGFEVLFGGGRRGSDSLPAVEAGMSMLDISDEELSKKVMCLKRNLPTVREVLRVLEYFFQIGAASWSSPRWQEVVKIVSLNSA